MHAFTNKASKWQNGRARLTSANNHWTSCTWYARQSST